MKRILALIVLAVGVGSCDKPIRCDAEGYIVDIGSQPSGRQAELRFRNEQLLTRRTQRGNGTGPDYDPEALKRAKGCPS